VSIVALLDPLGVGVISSADRDLGGDLAVIVLIADRMEGELEAMVSLMFKVLDVVL